MNKLWRNTILVGIAIGILNIAHYLLSTRMAGVKIPFGLYPGGVPFASLSLLTGKGLPGMLKAVLVLGIGIVIGSLISSVISKELTLNRFRKSKLNKQKIIRAAIGGFLMGTGIWMANGCIIKHALSGIPGLMLSSMTALIGILAGIWTANKIEEKYS